MGIKLARVAVVLAFACCLAEAATQTNKQDKPGTGPGVAQWSGRNFADLKALQKPVCVYIFDPASKTPLPALMEGDKVLNAHDVQDKLSTLVCIKLSTGDKKHVTDWPADWLAKAKGGAAILLLSSDLTPVQAFDKSAPADSIGPGIVAVADKILKAEAQKNAKDKAK